MRSRLKLRHLLDEVVVLQQDRPVGPDGERVLVARYRDPGVGRGGLAALVRHDHRLRRSRIDGRHARHVHGTHANNTCKTVRAR